jgi:hypothetical protein
MTTIKSSKLRHAKVDLSSLSTRQHGRRIRYDLKSVIRARARAKHRQRAEASLGPWVIGRFIAHDGQVILQAVPIEIGFWINDAARLTTQLAKMARWRTRQGARQWLLRHPRQGCELINIHADRFVDPSCHDDNTPAADSKLSQGQRGRNRDRHCRSDNGHTNHPRRG